jgi:hypothetical protein
MREVWIEERDRSLGAGSSQAKVSCQLLMILGLMRRLRDLAMMRKGSAIAQHFLLT